MRDEEPLMIDTPVCVITKDEIKKALKKKKKGKALGPYNIQFRNFDQMPISSQICQALIATCKKNLAEFILLPLFGYSLFFSVCLVDKVNKCLRISLFLLFVVIESYKFLK